MERFIVAEKWGGEQHVGADYGQGWCRGRRFGRPNAVIAGWAGGRRRWLTGAIPRLDRGGVLGYGGKNG